MPHVSLHRDCIRQVETDAPWDGPVYRTFAVISRYILFYSLTLMFFIGLLSFPVWLITAPLALAAGWKGWLSPPGERADTAGAVRIILKLARSKKKVVRHAKPNGRLILGHLAVVAAAYGLSHLAALSGSPAIQGLGRQLGALSVCWLMAGFMKMAIYDSRLKLVRFHTPDVSYGGISATLDRYASSTASGSIQMRPLFRFLTSRIGLIILTFGAIMLSIGSTQGEPMGAKLPSVNGAFFMPYFIALIFVMPYLEGPARWRYKAIARTLADRMIYPR